jgi:VIT1/CCC1 family predicted Fe2+/Mn2+ transporter
MTRDEPSAARSGRSGAGGSSSAEIHHQHRDVTGGWLRPAVFGAMDGLVSNFALIAGVAGGGAEQTVVVLAGLAGLAAGAFSMAAGEYISVASQSELAEAEIEVERRELDRHPRAEQAELARSFEERGVDRETAAEVARQLSRDPDEALDIHVREELGVDPGNLPSPVLAAGSSFASFAVGALLPVLPYLLGAHNLWPAAVIAGVGLFTAGAVVSRVTVRTWWFSGLRQLLLGGVAAAITYGVGALIGANGV